MLPQLKDYEDRIHDIWHNQLGNSSATTPYTLCFHNFEIKKVKHTKYLGLIVDDTFKVFGILATSTRTINKTRPNDLNIITGTFSLSLKLNCDYAKY